MSERTKRRRSSYNCAKCGQPKRGHVCPYRQRLVNLEPADTQTVGCQAELDPRFAVRFLDLTSQGLPASYGEKVPAPVAPFQMPNDQHPFPPKEDHHTFPPKEDHPFPTSNQGLHYDASLLRQQQGICA